MCVAEISLAWRHHVDAEAQQAEKIIFLSHLEALIPRLVSFRTQRALIKSAFAFSPIFFFHIFASEQLIRSDSCRDQELNRPTTMCGVVSQFIGFVV